MRKYKAKYEYVSDGKSRVERITFFSNHYANGRPNYSDARSEIRRFKGDCIADNCVIIFTYLDN